MSTKTVCDNCGVDSVPIGGGWITVTSAEGMFDPIINQRWANLAGDFCSLDCLLEATKRVRHELEQQIKKGKALLRQ